MAGYTRQDTANNIANGNVIDADDLDGEFNQVESAFNASSGHVHDGTTGNGAPITKVGPSQDLIVSATQVLPKTTNTLDLGSGAAQFKDAYFDGTVDTDTLTVSGNGTVGGTLGVTGATTLSSTAAITGNTTVGGTLEVTGQTTLNGGLVMDTDKFVVANTTGNTTIAGTLGVTGLSTLATVDINGGAIDGTVIGANSAAAITATTITGTSLVGPLTGNASTATALETARSITIDGDVDASATNFDGTGNITLTTTLDTVNSNVGSFGSATAIPVLTVNGKGLVTAASTAAITTTLTVGADSGSNDTVALASDTLNFAGTSNEIETTVSNNQIQIGLPNNVTVGGNLTVSGNMTVSGTTTTVNTETINLADNQIVLNSNETGTPSQNGGIEIERGTSANKTFVWNESTDKWTVGSETLVAGTFEGNLTGDVTGTIQTAAQSNITSLGTLTSLTVDDININGSTISDSGSMTLDVEGDLNLDVNGADIFLKDSGTIRGSINIGTANTVKLKAGSNTEEQLRLTQSGVNVLEGLRVGDTTAPTDNDIYAVADIEAGNDVTAGNQIKMTAGSSDWSFEISSNNLIIRYGSGVGSAKMKLDTSGNLTVIGDITAFGTI